MDIAVWHAPHTAWMHAGELLAEAAIHEYPACLRPCSRRAVGDADIEAVGDADVEAQ